MFLHMWVHGIQSRVCSMSFQSCLLCHHVSCGSEVVCSKQQMPLLSSLPFRVAVSSAATREGRVSSPQACHP